MADTTIQLGGVMKLGNTGTVASMTDFSDSLDKLVLKFTANKVAKKPTYANPLGYSKPGFKSVTIDLDGLSDENTASSLWATLWTAYLAGSLVYFYGLWLPTGTAIGATNQAFGGSFYVDSMDAGYEVGTDKVLSKTYECASWVGPLTVAPTTIT